MSRSTHERISDDIDLPVLAPRWPEPDTTRRGDGPDPAATPAHLAVDTRSSSPTLRPKTRRLRVAGLVIAAAVVGSAGTHWVDEPRTRTFTPPWAASCQDAINATARLRRLRDVQFERAMQDTWALVGGVHVQDLNPMDTSVNARLQRDADNATARCISPASPTP